MLLFTAVKIAQIQTQVNKSKFSNSEFSNSGLFNYLDSLVKDYSRKHTEELSEYQVNFDAPLSITQQILGVTNSDQTTVNEDYNLVKDFNLVDFASFLDNVIKTNSQKQPSEESIRDLASKNIFRAHINQQVSKALGQMFVQDHLKSDTNEVISSLTSSNIGLEIEELHKAMSDDSREHLYIFDIDGTLKEEELNCLSHAVPNISEDVKNDLIALSKRLHTTVLMLTSRGVDEIQESNVPDDVIPVVTGYGREKINGKKHEILVGEEFIQETGKFVDHLHTLMKNLGLNESQYLIRQYAGSVYIQFKENNFAKAKLDAMQALKTVLKDNDSGWNLADIGARYIFFNNSRLKYDKGDALRKMLEENSEKINGKTNIYVLGDTSSDYKAMEALHELSLPEGVQKFNIAVGNKLDGQSVVTHKVSSHHAIEDLLGLLNISSK